MMEERGVFVDQTWINRWVIRFCCYLKKFSASANRGSSQFYALAG
jgi:transposase-like protein